MNNSKIEWCDMTWNPVTGCLHGCEYCYARRIAKRFAGRYDIDSEANIRPSEKGIAQETSFGGHFYETKKNKLIRASYPYGFDPTFHRYRLDEPQGTKKPQNIFVCSMADLFGEWVLDRWILEVFAACKKAPQHRYLFLTKNSNHYYKLSDWLDIKASGNMWFGASASDATNAHCVSETLALIEFNTFLSLEPLHEDVARYTDFCGVKWVIIGAETGNRKSKVIPKREWIANIVDECRNYDIPVFMKNSLADIWGEPLIQEYPWKEENKK